VVLTLNSENKRSSEIMETQVQHATTQTTQATQTHQAKNASILVAYGSKYGATAEIAQRIGLVLREAGLTVNIERADLVQSLDNHAAVVLGSAVYAGQWMKEAAHFLGLHAPALATRPVWLFSSGPTGAGNPVEQMHGWSFPESLRPLADRIGPREIAFFHGRIDPHQLNFGERLLIAALRAEVGDFRNWAAIDAWAEAIAQALQAPTPQPAPTAPAVQPISQAAKQALAQR
jgi:menaquinone-dependent protoporphyrinogen oxidase